MNQLSIMNQELERSIFEKDQTTLNLTNIIKDLEEQCESNLNIKKENEKVSH